MTTLGPQKRPRLRPYCMRKWGVTCFFARSQSEEKGQSQVAFCAKNSVKPRITNSVG